MDSDELYIGKENGIYCKEKAVEMKHHETFHIVAMRRSATPSETP